MSKTEIKATFFSPEEEQQIVQSIQLAELNTSGEVRVHLEEGRDGDTYKRAVEVFEALKMHETAERNGILFYLAIGKRQFALVGDEGIHRKVSQRFWDEVRDAVLAHFKNGNYVQGLCSGIETCGEALSEYFPYTRDDVNELSDDISQDHIE